MAAFKEPKKFGVIPGNAADVTAIQDAGSVLNPSMTDLFPAIYQLALAAGGKAPERTTFNQFLKLYGEALYFLQRGGVWSYDATADYPAGAVVGYSGSLYLALKDSGEGTDAGAVQPDADIQILHTGTMVLRVLILSPLSESDKAALDNLPWLPAGVGLEMYQVITPTFGFAGTELQNFCNGTFATYGITKL